MTVAMHNANGVRALSLWSTGAMSPASESSAA